MFYKNVGRLWRVSDCEELVWYSKKREDNKRYRQNMTKVQKEKLKEYNKRYRQNMTEEQKNKTITPL